ncbi:ATP-binding protein [Kitasatospora sp. NBC_01287]|uniref:ATP-binding protein n=1 Tax=Kitasatospora sp. NBC_01287 TaxID=2903573 RepID=UPI00225B87C0|nr:ATP-binding protein [Kitasatospora sp. NBC_01287]MCX4749191.1 ATP-binding protein [Kitasatospora sp. NBC_01287]
MHRVLQFTTPLRTASVGVARDRLLYQIANLAGISLTADQKYALRLCASEAIANGIEYGYHGTLVDDSTQLLIEADMHRGESWLRVTVTDGGLRTPAMEGHADDLQATSGRGLVVMTGYADRVGWGPRQNGEGEIVGWSVWFELDVQPLSITGQDTAAQQHAAEVQPDVQEELDRRTRVARRIAILTAASRVRHVRPVIRIGTMVRGVRGSAPLDSGRGAAA